MPPSTPDTTPPAAPDPITAPVLVTGASGNVGREVLACLRERGVAVRIGSRDGTAEGLRAGETAVRLDLLDPSTFATAVAGCRALFLLRPPAIADTGATLVPLIDAASAAGAGQVVFLSVAGADRMPFVPHHAVEKHLRAGPPGWTILRPGFFAQNLGTAYRRDIARDDRLYVPAGRGRVAFVDVRDVGEVAARALLDPGAHRGQAYTLTGPDAVTFAEAARLLTAALGRPVHYAAASVVGYLWHLRRSGMPWAQALVQTALHVGLRFGQAARVDPTLERLLGRPPRPLADYIAAHRALWRDDA